MGRRGSKTKRGSTQSNLSIFLIVLALAVYMGVAWFYVTKSYEKQPLPTHPISTGQIYTALNLSKSLDLRIAGRANYTSPAISEVRSLGNASDVHKEVISFRVLPDNLTEYALMSTPTSKMPASGYPVIILCHGYYDPTQYQTTTGYLAEMQFYSQHGFVVIKPDYRGQGLSRDAGQPEGAYYSMAYNTDVMSLISAVGHTGKLNKSAINLWGQSMGAFIALRAAVLSPNVKSLILLSGPVGTARDMFQDYMAVSDKDNPVALKLRQSMLLKYGTPTSDPGFWNNSSPLSFLNKLNARVQIHVGTADNVVPPKFSADLDAALSKAGKMHEYYVYDGAEHGLQSQQSIIWPRSLTVLSSGIASSASN